MKEGSNTMNFSFLKGKGLLLVSALTLFLAGCGTNELSTLRPAGEVGREQFNLMVISIIFMILVFVVVTILFTIAVHNGLRSKKGEDFEPKEIAGHYTLEAIWTSIPYLLLLVLAVPIVYFVFEQAKTEASTDADGKVIAKETVINVRA